MTARDNFECDYDDWTARYDRLAALYPAANAELRRLLSVLPVEAIPDWTGRAGLPLYGLPELLAEVGPPPAAGPVELVRVSTRRGFVPGNLRWAACAPSPAAVAARPADSPFLTAADAAAYARQTPKTIQNWKCSGKLKAVPNTRPPLFLREELDLALSRRTRR